MTITAKRSFGSLSAILLTLAVGCGELDDEDDSSPSNDQAGPTADPKDETDQEATKDPTVAASSGRGVTEPDAGPVDTGTTVLTTTDAAPDVPAVDAATPDSDAQAVDSGARPTVDPGAVPTVPAGSCRENFDTCIRRSQADYKIDPLEVQGKTNPFTGMSDFNLAEKIITPCVPAAEACGLFQNGTGKECLDKYFDALGPNGANLSPGVQVGQECGLFKPGAEECLGTFYECAAFAVLNPLTLVPAQGKCLTDAQDCGLVPALTSLGGWFQ